MGAAECCGEGLRPIYLLHSEALGRGRAINATDMLGAS